MPNDTQTTLSRLAAADRGHQKEAGLTLLLRGIKYACGAVLGLFVLDVIFHLGAGWRLGLLLACLFAVAVLLGYCGHVAFVRRNRVEHIARFLERRDPALGSRLINLLQLDEQTRDESLAPLTRDLARQAVKNYAGQLGEIPIERLARTEAPRHHLKSAGWIFVGFMVVLLIGFHITGIEMARFLDPFGDHPPYSITELAIVQPGPPGTKVIYGKGLIVKVKALGHQPKEVFLTSFPPGHPEQAVTVPMFDEGGAGYNLSLDNIHTELVVYAHTRDHFTESKQVRIGLILTPQIENVYVQTSPPAYTGIRPSEKTYDRKGVQALEGSQVQFRIQSNRPLHEGRLEITSGDQPPQEITLKKSGETEVTGSFAAADSGRLQLGVVDVDGLNSPANDEGALTVTHDLPPEIHITNPAHDAFVAMDFKLQAQIEASDDYGLHEIRLHCGVNGNYPSPRKFSYQTVVLSTNLTADLNFTDLGVKPGDVISLFAEAVDNAPQPHLSHSQTVHLKVISVEDYNNYLREQSDISDTEAKYTALNNEVHDLVEKQKEISAAVQKLKSDLAHADAKQTAASSQQLDGLIAQQNQLNSDLNREAARMEHFVRQEPLYDVEKDVQQILQQQAASIRASTQANETAMRDLAQRSSPPQGPRQLSEGMLDDFAIAADTQAAQLGHAHDETQSQVVQPLEDMTLMQELLKDFNLFDSLYRKQVELTQQAQAYNRPGQLEREDQLALKDLAGTEKGVGDTLVELRAKLDDDAKAAQKLFPKAAQSGKDLAQQIDDAFMPSLAEKAANQMLAAAGDQSFLLADRLRAAMENLFNTCHGGNCPSGSELDTYLSLQHMSPGANFAQMSLSRKFGLGQGFGDASGGSSGTSGFAMQDGSNPSVMGNEAAQSQGEAAAKQSQPYGKGKGALEAGSKGLAGTPDVLTGLNPVNRQSAANSSETINDEYHDVVDNYFRTITTKKNQPADEKSK